MIKRVLVLSTLCFVLLTATHSTARVFRRWSSASQSSEALRALGGTQGYESEVKVNNSKGVLTAFGFESEIGQVMRKLKQAFKTDTIAYSGGTMAFIDVRTDALVLRMVVIYLVQQKKTVVFKLEQTQAQFRSSKKPPDRHLLTAIPEYPQSTPTFYLKDEETQLGMAVSKSRTAPEMVQAFYKVQFAQLDWKGLYPLEPKDPDKTPQYSSPPSALSIYQKGPHLCYVYAANSEVPGETRITLLHKPLGMK